MTDARAAVTDTESSWDLGPVASFLSARSESRAEAAWVDALPAISERFVPDSWAVDHSTNPYGQGAHSNLYRVECQKDFRDWLQTAGISEEDYGGFVGAVQYVSFQVNLRSLMDRPRSNKGWRIRVIGFPSLGVIACGLSSHYQGTQNHNQMGRASQLIRTRALEVVSGESREALEDWPAATPEHWEERGLMPEPVLEIGSLDISTYDEGKGAKLRMVRNTTVKKELATFFALKGMTHEQFVQNGPDYLETLRRVAFDLGRLEA